MKECGLELFFEIVEFWLSCVINCNGWLEIFDVIGLDEYIEYIDNNMYMNYMVYYNVKKVLEWNKDNVDFVVCVEVFFEKIYLFVVNEFGLIL